MRESRLVRGTRKLCFFTLRQAVFGFSHGCSRFLALACGVGRRGGRLFARSHRAVLELTVGGLSPFRTKSSS